MPGPKFCSESGKPKEEFKLSLLVIKSQPQEADGLDDFTYEDRKNE